MRPSRSDPIRSDPIRSDPIAIQMSCDPGEEKGLAMMDSLACLNGELMPVDQARVPIWDRGFLFGDAVYEVFRLYQGCCWLEDEHMARLRRSLAAIELDAIDLDQLTSRLHRTISSSEIQEGTAYVHITRGVAPRAHAYPFPAVPPTELIVIRPYDDQPVARLREQGVGTISRPDLRWKLCDLKTTNLLPNVMALEAAHRAGCFEAILVAENGLVTEATHTSVLWVRDGRLEGTPEGHGILPGTTRQLVLRLCEEIGLPFVAAEVTLPALIGADEVLLAGTTTEILSIVRIDDQSVADGAPGPVSRRLQEAYRTAVERWLAPQPV
jgi:D-alanine transaminase